MAIHLFLSLCFVVVVGLSAIVVSLEFVGANFCGMTFFLLARNGDILWICLNMFL